MRKTDGVPLFVEELTKVVLESGLLQEQEDRYDLTGPLPPLAIPATLHDALMARLDRLAAAKLVAQLGAVIGRTFAYDLVQAVAPLDAATLQGALAQLVEAELVVAARHAPTGHVHVQARADPGRGVSVAAAEHAAAVPSAHCAGAGGAVSRDCRDAARTAGASLYGGRAHSAGHPLLAAGRAAGLPALGQPGSGPAPDHRHGAARHAPRDPGAGAAGAGPAARPGASA